MRRHALILLLVIASSASAEPKRASDKPKPIDPKAVLDKLEAYRDDLGNYYIIPGEDGWASSDDANQWVFYGDGKTLYQQRIIGSSVEGHRREWYVWSPRAKGMQAAEISVAPDKASVECKRSDGHRPVTQLKADEVKTLLAHATFLPPLWIRLSHFLARDDDGVYYFVDKLRDEYGGAGYRVFMGPKGSMKEIAMTNMASDSAGEIFATKSGQLKIITGSDGKAYWIKGGKKAELTVLDPADNRYLIYRELGIYGQLGTFCDDI